MEPEEVMALGREAANLYGVPPDIYLRLIRRESGFNPNRVSDKGAVGLAQLMPATAEGMGVYIKDPIENIRGGAQYLREMYDRFGDWTLAVAAYNAGPENVKEYGNNIPPFRETEEYIANIMGGLPLMGENILQPYSDGMPPPRRPENTEDLSALIGIMEDELWTEGGKGERHPALTEFVQSIRDRYRGVEQPKLPYRPRSDIPGTNLKQHFNDGGVVAGAPNRMAAYQMATRPAAPVTSILDFDPEQFVAALDELGVTGEERAALEQQYFAQQRALPMTERPENMRVGTVAPIAFPEGMTGAEALMSGNFEFTAPELARALYEAPAEAANVAGATVRGVPVTEQQMQEAASGLAETITGIGPARAGVRAARGIESLQPNVVSMSGVRGMGDNGGPALEQFDENGFLRLDDIPAGPPRRFIHPQSGLYSPSFEAAKNLPQEVGTPEQMRSMLLKGGAKEEELVYSGFDDWLRGKERVTKQEIENVLGEAAAGAGAFEDSMPYVRVSAAAGSGVTGTSGGVTIGRLRGDVYDRRRQEAQEARNNELMSEIQALGYRPLQFTDENDFRAVTNQLRESFANRRNDYFDRDMNALPDRKIREALFEAQDLMEMTGLPFDSPQVQNLLQPLSRRSNIGVQQFIGPSGRIESSTPILIRMGREEQNGDLPFFDVVTTSQRDRMRAEVDAMPMDQLVGYLGLNPDDVFEGFDPGGTRYGTFVVPGMRNYSENQYFYRDEGRGVLSGIERLGVRAYDQKHFNAGKKPLMFFTLTGELNTPEGPAYNLATIQSDIGQAYDDNPDQFFVPGSTPTAIELSKPQKQTLQTYVDKGRKFKELQQDAEDKYNLLIADYMDFESGDFMRNAPGYSEARDAVNEARAKAEEVKQQLTDIELDNAPLFTNLDLSYGNVRTLAQVDRPGDFNVDRFSDILSGSAVSERSLMSKKAALPFATSTNRWLDAALKNELVNAAKAGAEWITIPKGDDVQRYTFGKLSGQRKFYGGPDDKGIAPMRLKNLAKKLIPFETEFKDFKATGFGPNPPTYNVSGMRLTPEIRKYILENGLPSFAKGGPVDGSSLDVDVFALG